MLVAGQLESDLPVIGRKPGISRVDRAPSQLFRKHVDTYSLIRIIEDNSSNFSADLYKTSRPAPESMGP